MPGVTILGGEDPPPTPRELLSAFHYPDRSAIIDLSHVPHEEKVAHIRSVLPALNVMRRRAGLRHRILLDEAHYFLHDAEASHLLDLETNGYTIVTYCAWRLSPALLAATEVMLVTVTESRAFHIAGNGAAPRRARTLRQFVDALEHSSMPALAAYLRRGDFSRWISELFGDNALAEELRTEEKKFRTRADDDVLPEIVGAIRARYDLTKCRVRQRQGRRHGGSCQ